MTTTTISMLAPAGGKATYAGDFNNRRNYIGADGTVLSVPIYDVAKLTADGWVVLPSSGTTAQRPQHADPAFARGSYYRDTDLSLLIVHDGSVWRSATDGSIV